MIFCKKIVSVFLLFLLITAVSAEIKDLIKRLPQLEFNGEPNVNREIMEYFNTYSLRFDNTRHYIGYINSTGYKIASNIYRVENPLGTVILSHGYVSHSALMSYFIKYFTENGYNVAMFDMPGHGLSEGARADMDDFHKYGTVLRDFINKLYPDLEGPYTLVGHSMGCAAAFEYLRCFDNKIINNVVFTAPLVRLAWHKSSKYTSFFMDPFINNVSRIYRDSSEDEQYKNFIKYKDPLKTTKVPLSWFEALYKWNKIIKKAERLNRKILVIQGLEDNIVEYKYNIKYLKEKTLNLECVKINNAKHDLLNEQRAIRENVFNTILNYISIKN